MTSPKKIILIKKFEKSYFDKLIRKLKFILGKITYIHVQIPLSILLDISSIKANII